MLSKIKNLFKGLFRKENQEPTKVEAFVIKEEEEEIRVLNLIPARKKLEVNTPKKQPKKKTRKPDNKHVKAKRTVIKTPEGLGIDIGISRFCIFSDGTEILNPIFKNHISVYHMAKKDFKVFRDLAHNKAINYAIGLKPTFITVESIDFSGNNIPKDIKIKADYLDFHLFFRRLEEACRKENIEFRQLLPMERSSKMCYNCGAINKGLKLSDRTYVCSKCHFKISRDLNAALNIRDKCKYKVIYARKYCR